MKVPCLKFYLLAILTCLLENRQGAWEKICFPESQMMWRNFSDACISFIAAKLHQQRDPKIKYLTTIQICVDDPRYSITTIIIIIFITIIYLSLALPMMGILLSKPFVTQVHSFSLSILLTVLIHFCRLFPSPSLSPLAHHPICVAVYRNQERKLEGKQFSLKIWCGYNGILLSH